MNEYLMGAAEQIGKQMAREKVASAGERAAAVASLLYGSGQVPGYFFGRADGRDMRDKREPYPRIDAKSALGMLLPGGLGYAIGKRVGHAEPPKKARR